MPERLTVLMVDDNPADVDLAREALAEVCPQATLHAVSGGEDALAFLRDGAATGVALVLLDLNLPRMNGLEVLRELRRLPDSPLASLPVVVLSTSEAEADVRASREGGASAYRSKPLGYSEHVALMRELVDTWLGTPSRP